MFRRGTLALSLVLMAACSDYVSTSGPEHCGAVGDGEIWGKDLSPHTVTCDVTITGDLTVGPGAEIRFDPGISLLVLGSLHVDGKVDSPAIMMASKDSDPWVGVHVLGSEDDEERLFPDPTDLPSEVGTGDVHLTHLEVRGAGARTTSERSGGILVERGPVHAEGLTIDGSADCGLLLREGGRLSGDASGISLRGNQVAVCAHAEGVSSLHADDLEIADSVIPGIQVLGGEISGRHVWENLGTPYLIDEDLTVWRGDLEVQAGTTLTLGSGVNLRVGKDEAGPHYGSDPSGGTGVTRRQSSSLNLAGTAEAPVTLTAPEGQHWGRLQLDVGSVKGKDGDGNDIEVLEGGATLSHVVLENGGLIAADPDRTATLVTRRRGFVHADDLTIKGSDSGGFWFEGGGFSSNSRDVSVTGGAFAGYVSPDGASTLPTSGSSYADNAVGEGVNGRSGDVFYVGGGTISVSGTWADHGVPWQLEGGVEVGSGIDAVTWTVAPGNELHIPADVAIVVGYDGPGAVEFGDVSGEEVLLTYGEWGASGDHWHGVTFDSKTLPSTLENTRIALAGSSDESAALFLRSSPALAVTLKDVTIEDPEHMGFLLWTPLSSASANLTVTGAPVVGEAVVDSAASVPEDGADLTGNDGAFVRISGRRMAHSGTWADLGVPYRIEEPVFVHGFRDDDDVRHNAVLTIDSGTTIEFGPTGALHFEDYVGAQWDGVGSVRINGSETSEVVLRAIDESGTWGGVEIRDQDPELSATASVLKHVQIDGGGESALGALVLRDASPTLDQVRITRAKNHGLFMEGTCFLTDANSDKVYWGDDEDAFYDEHAPSWLVWGDGDERNNDDWVESVDDPDRNVMDQRPWTLEEPIEE